MVTRDTMFHHPVGQSQGQRRNGVDATCRADEAIAVVFDDAGTA